MTSPSGGKNGTQSLFTPPRGGDLTLRSSDGVEFLVHSTILKFSSSVFDGMIATGTTKDTVELTENANDVSYLLRFVYPNKFPVSISLDELPSCLLVVQKYDIEGALEIIEEIILLDGSPHRLLSSEPIRTYQLAVQFNLAKTKAAVAPLVAIDQTNFCDLSKLSELSNLSSNEAGSHDELTGNEV
ncbi:The BTB (BR-C, ttk and bab)/POZ (Pox virus and Zinc finger) domain [Rhizoctonia solani]|uniref:The BTB (BR-C, ttk and bab)/POZ (Pox virus and Zinc finger) domain n=1 Tax=Rhizoctonia solani TaxID=456999 RepID=A0A8H8NLA4_9AGAM|nr:The BTB (BR-C, ttk and bab)/POZ (Pox virus and Zinc finger) domain [Rhizoctonia solani]QRW15814.1 The BTB (BR-C, ttk and bab)/POZ (Pox virus and Zinc finger) domain [Rhizoctonia solani]